MNHHTLAALLAAFPLLLAPVACDAQTTPAGAPSAPAAAGGPAAVGRGGGANADFDSLIDLIVSTVAPDSWAENGGGEAEVRPFVSGVYADPAGVLLRRDGPAAGLVGRRESAAPPRDPVPPAGPRRAAPLRCVSLARLDAEVGRRQAAGVPLDADMLALAGLRRVTHVFLFPEEHDIALAGPAAGWRVTPEGRIVSLADGAPVARLDDLVELLRRARGVKPPPFGCTIDPRPASLRETARFLAESGERPLTPGGRGRWLNDLRQALGRQDVRTFGVPPTSRVACVLAEADHHMKLVGMGLAPGVDGVESYLDSLTLGPDGEPPAGGVIRWWFTMDYDAVESTPDRLAHQVRGRGARVESENERLTRLGERAPLGGADAPTRAFASAFSQRFDAFCSAYPVYGELRAVFDLALVAALLEREDAYARVAWRPGLLLDAERLPLPGYRAPTEVDSVVNYRVMGRRHVVAGVSGGVYADPAEVLRRRGRVVPQGPSAGASPLDDARTQAPPEIGMPGGQPLPWWWDARPADGP